MMISRNDVKCWIDELGFKSAYLKHFREHSKDIVGAFWNHSERPDKLAEVLYCAYHDIAPPMCPNGHKLDFIDFSKGYREYKCSREDCSILSDYRGRQKKNIGAPKRAPIPREQKAAIEARRRATCLERYGVEHYSMTTQQREVSRNNVKATQTKGKETLRARYGVDNIFKLESFQKKATHTILERFGVENVGSAHFSPETRAVLHDREKFIAFCTGLNYEMVSRKLGDVSAAHVGILARKYECVEIFNFGQGSCYQEELADWLRHQTDLEFVQNTRSIIRPKEIDIWIPSKSVGLEMDGLYHHSEITGRKIKDYHADKQNAARAIDIGLVQITTDEWMFRNQQVKEILRRLLGFGSLTRVPARKCTVSKKSWSDVSAFIAEHHLQGSGSPTRFNFALEYEGSIISVMTFSNGRKSVSAKGWELTRYVEQSGLHVVGGAERLFKHAISSLNIDEVVSYSDRRYFNGRVYSRLNFKYDGLTKPGYHYTDYYKKYSRFNFTKSKLVEQGFDSQLSEWEIMQQRGYDRYWDAGHDRWIWRSEKQ